MLIPLLTIADTQSLTGLVPSIDVGRVRNLDGSVNEDSSNISSRDVETLGASFIVALAAYALFKRRTPRRRQMSIGPYSY